MPPIGRLLVASAMAFSVASAGCRAAIDDVTYACTRERRYPSDGGEPDRGYPYAELFDDDEGDERMATLRDRCWEPHDTTDTDMLASESDLIIRPNRRAMWTEAKRAPSLVQHVDGDFVIVTRAEPVGLNGDMSDHCNLGPDDVAGLVVRRSEQPAGWLTFTVRPFDVTAENCLDDAAMPPSAIVERKGQGPGIASDSGLMASKESVGQDGEADIAICRQANRLLTFYRDGMRRPNWQEVGSPVAVARGGVDAGLTTGTSGEHAMEGHFNFVVLQSVGTLAGDGCAAALASFVDPEPEAM